jgi:hypothetical protein
MLVLTLLFTFILTPAASCHQVRAFSLHEGIGWSHYVEITNTCDAPVECLVATNVDPWPEYYVRVPASEVERVRTRFGSTFPRFEPIATCDLASPEEG